MRGLDAELSGVVPGGRRRYFLAGCIARLAVWVSLGLVGPLLQGPELGKQIRVQSEVRRRRWVLRFLEALLGGWWCRCRRYFFVQLVFRHLVLEASGHRGRHVRCALAARWCQPSAGERGHAEPGGQPDSNGLP
ncbi:MAG: hypothetical protein JOZ15_20875 [Acidobacteria bacterium]|nr:hypothetical protein [Acidobacteriota bacterium]